MGSSGRREVLVLGGGSNLVVADAGFPGTVVRIAIPGIEIGPDLPDGTVEVTVGAGENWDTVVEVLVAAGLTGLAPLSGIPGSTGATPVQNVGAYGTEIGDMLTAVTFYDRATGDIARHPVEELQLGYRSSALRGTERAVITDITLRLGREPKPVRYAELARTLGVEVGQTASEAVQREAVLRLRRGKAMVIQPGVDDPDTRSAGSFFTNPILDRDEAARADSAIRGRLGEDVSYPHYPAGAGTEETLRCLADRASRIQPGIRRARRTRRAFQQAHPGSGQPERQHRRPPGPGPGDPGRGARDVPCRAASGARTGRRHARRVTRFTGERRALARPGRQGFHRLRLPLEVRPGTGRRSGVRRARRPEGSGEQGCASVL